MNSSRWPLLLLVIVLLLGVILFFRAPGDQPRQFLVDSPSNDAPITLPPVEPGSLSPRENVIIRTPGSGEGKFEWRVRVLDELSQAPVDGAELRLVGEASTSLLGETNADGFWRGKVDSPEDSWSLALVAEGYLDRRLTCTSQTQTITLAPEGQIRGVVLGRSTAIQDAQYWVIAWPSNLATAQVLAPISALPNEHTTLSRVAPDGTFELRGLHKARLYSLVCVGEGFGTEEIPRRIPADGRSITISIAPLHGAVVSYTRQDGSPLRTSKHVFQDLPHSPYGVNKLSGSVVESNSPNAIVLGLAEVASETFANARVMIVLNHEPEKPVMVEYAAARPGYVPVSGQLALPRIGREIPRIKIPMEEWAEEWGSVRLRITGGPMIERRPFTYGSTPDAIVQVVSLDHLAAPLEVPLSLSSPWPDLADRQLEVGPIPAGRYKISLVSVLDSIGEISDDVLTSELAQEVLIEPSNEAMASFDIGARALLRAELMDGVAVYSGAVSLALFNEEGGMAVFSLAGPPYRVPLAPAIPLSVGVPAGFRGVGPNAGFSPIPVVLLPGKESSVQVTLPKG
jgi:hypothetical protein